MKRTLGIAIITASIAWLPSICLHWLRGSSFGNLDIVTISVLMPLAAVAEWLYVYRRGKPRSNVYFLTLAFVWLLGPIAFFVGAAASASGFRAPGSWRALGELLMIAPIATFLGSAYDGSMLGLALISAALLGGGFVTALRQPRVG